jgi:hypothetical protein
VISRVISSTLVVPSAAVRQPPGEGRPYVYRIANRMIDVAPVQVGVVDDRIGTTQVLDGLSEGDRVIVGQVGAIGRGMQVIIAGEERQGSRQGSNGNARP